MLERQLHYGYILIHLVFSSRSFASGGMGSSNRVNDNKIPGIVSLGKPKLLRKSIERKEIEKKKLFTVLWKISLFFSVRHTMSDFLCEKKWVIWKQQMDDSFARREWFSLMCAELLYSGFSFLLIFSEDSSLKRCVLLCSSIKSCGRSQIYASMVLKAIHTCKSLNKKRALLILIEKRFFTRKNA